MRGRALGAFVGAPRTPRVRGGGPRPHFGFARGIIHGAYGVLVRSGPIRDGLGHGGRGMGGLGGGA